MIEHLAASYRESGLNDVLGPDVTLVPAPRSAPLVGGALWPAGAIAEALVFVGLGAEVLPILTRRVTVAKSAFAARGSRPDPRVHYDTITIERHLPSGRRVTIIDDFVTKGATMLACAILLHEFLPAVELNAFALVRTMGLQKDVERIIQPNLGHIRGRLEGCDRFD